jgi:hypothetical protein
MKLATKLGVITASTALFFTTIAVNSVQALTYTLTNTNANGTVDTSVPGQITITGGNNGTGNPGTTYYTATASSNSNSSVSFSWSYTTNDQDSSLDPFGFVNNGTVDYILNNSQFTASGNYSAIVNQGNTFGFGIETVDNLSGSANVTISNLAITPVPFEGSPALGLFFIGAGYGIKKVLKLKKVSA